VTKVHNIYVPFVGPNNARILCVGEGPGEKEERPFDIDGNPLSPRPFHGPAGDILTSTFMRHGPSRETLRLCNLSHYRPVGNKFDNLLDTHELAEGIADLKHDIETIKPNVIVALGANPLKYLTGFSVISQWRGSVLDCTLVEGYKVLATFHPSFILQSSGTNFPAFDSDIRRAVEQSAFSDIRIPERNICINPTEQELIDWESRLAESKYISTDIETIKKSGKMTCIAFAPNPHEAICVPTDTLQRRDMISRVLANKVPKLFHYGYFDYPKLELQGIPVINWRHDTYVGQHIIAPELPNTLGYLNSMYTEQPNYKSSGHDITKGDQKAWADRFENANELYIYNGHDVCSTAEIHEQQLEELTPNLRAFYDFEMELTNGPLRDLSNAGMLIDETTRARFKIALLKQWVEYQEKLNLIAGRFYIKKPKKVPGTDMFQFINVGSSPQMMELFYDELGVRIRRNRKSKPHLPEEALISIITEAKGELQTKVKPDAITRWQTIFVAARLTIIIRGIRKLLSSYIDVTASSDGRFRSTYKVGPETGRLAASKYVDDSGFNGMTVPRGDVITDIAADKKEPLRSMFVAPSGHVLIQFDFAQAETWITAYLAWEEKLIAGLKSGDVHLTTARLIYELEQITKTQRYMGKKGNHQLSYGSTYLRLAQSINGESDVTGITATNTEAKDIYEKWHQAYPAIKQWWESVRHQLERNNRLLITPYGRERIFFDKWGKDLFKAAYAHVPQSTVADHTNGYIHPELGVKGGLIEVWRQFVKKDYIKLTNQSHDSIKIECPQQNADDIIPQVYQLMHRPIVVSGEEFTIPVDVTIGERWGLLEKYKMGD